MTLVALKKLFRVERGLSQRTQITQRGMLQAALFRRDYYLIAYYCKMVDRNYIWRLK